MGAVLENTSKFVVCARTVHSTRRNMVLENCLQGEKQPPEKKEAFPEGTAPSRGCGELDPFRAQGALHPKLIHRQCRTGCAEVTSSPVHAQAGTVHYLSEPSCAEDLRPHHRV